MTQAALKYRPAKPRGRISDSAGFSRKCTTLDEDTRAELEKMGGGSRSEGARRLARSLMGPALSLDGHDPGLGKKMFRTVLSLDGTSIAHLTAYGDGSLSLGIRRACLGRRELLPG
ncbi:MAG: hypothetical protein QM639_17500 [Rhodocyclaceae bacterium]